MSKILKVLKKIEGKTYPYRFQQKKLRDFVQHKYPIASDLNTRIDVSMLTLNRLEDTRRTLSSLYQTTVPFNLIVVDQKSNDGTRSYLEDFAKNNDNVNLILLEENKGVSGGRAIAVEHSTSEYLAFVDNDMVFMPNYFENLLRTLLENKQVVGVSGKSVKPDELIEVNSPTLEIVDKWALFGDKDTNKRYDDYSTLDQKECHWIPMGVSMWKTKTLRDIQIDSQLIGAYEDNEYTFRVTRLGHRLMNCPQSVVLHIKAEFTKAMGDKSYTKGRFNKDKLRFAVRHFYKKHGLYLAFGDKEASSKYLGFNSSKELEEFVNN